MLIDRQLVLAIEDNQVVRTIHVSTGKPFDPDHDRVVPRLRQVRALVVDAVPGVAVVGQRLHRGHRDAPVPRRAGLRGLARLRARNDKIDAKWLFDFNSVGEPVDVIAKST